ncbi:MAG TPA: hypothetical protein VFN10_19975 [Thermoanaerobaculia bacterium]|nr:hypothetical protein [Thermoanaerobaculia bacterium]
MPRKLRRDLPEFVIRTAQEEGWGAYQNGELLRRAAATFDVLVTLDQRMRHQQNVGHLGIAVVVIEIPDTRLVFIRALLPQLREAISSARAGDVLIIPTSR